jgi:hypothetical protein
MPRKRDIEAAIAAYSDTDDGLLLLPSDAARLLAVMFPRRSIWQGRFEDLVAAGIDRDTLRKLLRGLVDAGFFSTTGEQGMPPTYHLHLPPVRR